MPGNTDPNKPSKKTKYITSLEAENVKLRDALEEASEALRATALSCSHPEMDRYRVKRFCIEHMRACWEVLGHWPLDGP